MCFISGCGGGGGNPSSSGIEVVGQLVEGGLLVGTPGDPGELNPHYTNAYQVPSAYSIAISKLELLKSADDPDPYVLFDTGGVANAKVISFTGAPGDVNIGSNTQYPDPGSYTVVRVTCAYQQLTILADIGDGSGYIPHSFRVYNSTLGKMQDGDILVMMNAEWQWIKNGGHYPISGDRPDIFPGVLAAHEYLASAESDDPNTITITLATPLVIPANPNGKYTISGGFNLGASPEIANSTGTFAWDDVTVDGQFKPGVDMAQGGDGNQAEFEAYGAPLWTPLGPTITFTCGDL